MAEEKTQIIPDLTNFDNTGGIDCHISTLQSLL